MDTRANVRGRQVHPRLRLALATAALAAAAVCSISHAAPVPVTWCGSVPSPTDRPDIVGGDQIHVIYATPSDSPDRFTPVASAITTDLNAINSWWKRQDPTRAPRFDYAALGCTGLRLARHQRRQASARHGVLQPAVDPAARRCCATTSSPPASPIRRRSTSSTTTRRSRRRARNAATHTSARRAAAARGTRASTSRRTSKARARARGCGSIEASAPRGGFLAVVAAHELVNELGALDTATPGPPHRCPGDAFHPCDSNLDVLYPTPAATTIDAAILDFGHDDYYAHSGTWWDVQDSPWLRHLDVREYKLHVSVGAGGTSVAALDQPSVSCAAGASCTWTWAAGSSVNLSATAAAGYRFDCAGRAARASTDRSARCPSTRR